jgi:hypothetical protein
MTWINGKEGGCTSDDVGQRYFFSLCRTMVQLFQIEALPST